jgi:hypothetical protein
MVIVIEYYIISVRSVMITPSAVKERIVEWIVKRIIKKYPASIRIAVPCPIKAVIVIKIIVWVIAKG